MKCFTAIYINNGKLGDDQKRYRDLTKELKENTDNFSAYFNVIFILRRVACVAIVVFIEGAIVQIIISAAVHTTHLLWLICAQPFNSTLINVVEIYCEFIIVVTTFCMQNFVGHYDDEDMLATVLIILICSAICAYFIVIFRSLIV